MLVIPNSCQSGWTGFLPFSAGALSESREDFQEGRPKTNTQTHKQLKPQLQAPVKPGTRNFREVAWLYSVVSTHIISTLGAQLFGCSIEVDLIIIILWLDYQVSLYVLPVPYHGEVMETQERCQRAVLTHQVVSQVQFSKIVKFFQPCGRDFTFLCVKKKTWCIIN